jgi:hypothetical protein
VVTQGNKALVLFEDGKPDIERLARAIAERLEEQGCEVSVASAASVGISELLAAKLYLLGADSPVSPAYAEVARVFKGMNLAGRKAAFFGSSGATVAWLRGICADTEVSAAHSDFVGRSDQPALVTWLKTVLASS